jgi:cell shape-determining protein MreC
MSAELGALKEREMKKCCGPDQRQTKFTVSDPSISMKDRVVGTLKNEVGYLFTKVKQYADEAQTTRAELAKALNTIQQLRNENT